MGGSAYWTHVLGTLAGSPPPVDLQDEKRLIELLLELASKSLMSSCHDVSDGGLGIALAEGCIGVPYGDAPVGARVDLRGIQGELSDAEILFGEDQARVILTAHQDDVPVILELVGRVGLAGTPIGTVGIHGDSFRVELVHSPFEIDPVVLRQTYLDAIPRRMESLDN